MTAHDPHVTLTEVEVERLNYAVFATDCNFNDVLFEVRRVIAARLAPIRALADEWTDADHEPLTRDGLTVLTVTNRLGRDLRAALDAASADLTASQDRDGTEGHWTHGDGRNCRLQADGLWYVGGGIQCLRDHERNG